MKIDFVTLFPEMISAVLDAGVTGRARERDLVTIGFSNPRDFSKDKHRKVDDRPYGGGAGMVLKADPLYVAVKKAAQKSGHVVYLSPQGRRFDDAAARRLAALPHLVLVCGRYEGIDERVADIFDEEISIGDYVLTGGELPAMTVADAVIRLLPGVLKKEDATRAESFAGEGLDYPQYTRPRVWRNKKVPEILFSGDHEKIAQWRAKAAMRMTKRKRPDLLAAETRKSADALRENA